MTRPVPEFIPARPRRHLIRALEQLNRVVVLPWLRIEVDLPEADLARLQALPEHAGILVACNHPTYADPSVTFEVSRRWGRICTYMAAREVFNKFGGWMGTVIKRLGAFSVLRGGMNRFAEQFASRILRSGRFPIMVFPEGHTFYLNDVLLPLKPGVAAWAVDTVAEAGAPPVYVVPMAMRYEYTVDIKDALDAAVLQMERIVLERVEPVPDGEFWDRLYLRLHRIAHVILRRQEVRHHYRPPRGADLDERVRGLCSHILCDLERHYIGEVREGDFFDRARHLMAMLKDDMDHQKDAMDARFAWALSTFHAGYLSPDSSPERFAETVMKLQREITHRVPLTFRHWRKAHVRIGEPIEVAGYVPAAAATDAAARHEATREVLAELTSRMRGLLDELQGKPTVASPRMD